MKKAKTVPTGTITKQITITPYQCDELLDVLNAICELEMLSEHADDQPWTILKWLSEKAGPLADDLHEQKKQLEK